MSRIILDDDLLKWEAYASGGRFGLPDEARVVFHCLSDRSRRPRYVRMKADNAAAEQALQALSEEQLRQLLSESQELE